MDFFEIGLTLIALSVGLVVWHFRSERNALFTELLLEGATLSDLPSLDELLTNADAREAIKKHVVEIGFHPGTYGKGEGSYEEEVPPEVFIVDDGGGVHVLKHTASLSNLLNRHQTETLENKAAKLARLFDVDLRT